MSAQEPAVGFTDAGSSVKLVRNAKGDTQIEVKVRVGDSESDVAEARRIAQEVYAALHGAYPVGGA